MCPKKRLSGVKPLNPPGMERIEPYNLLDEWGTLHAVDCFRAAACPRVMEGATLTFRMYRIAFVITTLKLAPGTDETKQKEFLALLSFSLRLTPFKIERSWKKMSLWIGPIMSTVLLNPLPLGGRRLVAGKVKSSSSDFVHS